MTSKTEDVLSTQTPARSEKLSGRAPAIFVPLDGSAEAARALPVARALAKLEGASVHIVHLAQSPRPARELVDQLGLSALDLLGAVVEGLHGSTPEALLRLANQARLGRIVLWSEGGGAGLGPWVRQVLSEAECPVVVVGGRCSLAPWALRRALLPHDGSPLTSTAFAPPLRWIGLARAALFFLHVATPIGARGPGALGVPCYVDQPQHEWAQWAREFLGRIEAFGDLTAELAPQLLVSRGEPWEEIVRFASRRQIDLIGLAFRGGLEGEGAATLRRVLAWAPCPVVVQRVDEAELWSRCYPVPLRGPPGMSL